MIRVSVRALGSIRDLVGSRQVEIHVKENSTIQDVLVLLSKRRGKILEERIFDSETGKIKPDIRLLLNGQNVILLDGVKTRVNNRDVISILPSAGGG